MLNKDKSNQNEKTRNRAQYLLKEKSMKNILKVRMLGGFTLNIKEKNWSWTVTMYQRPHSCFNYYFYIHRMEESPKQHSSMPCMAEAMSKIKTAASTTQYSGSESSSPQRGFRKAVTSI